MKADNPIHIRYDDPDQLTHGWALEELTQEIASNFPCKLNEISTKALAEEYTELSVLDIDKEREAWWPRCMVPPEKPTHQNAKLTCAWNMPWGEEADIEWYHHDSKKDIAHRRNKRSVTELKISREEFQIDGLTPDVKFHTPRTGQEDGVALEAVSLGWLPLGDPQKTVTWLHKVAEKTRRYLKENCATCWVFAPTTPALAIKPAAEAVLAQVTRYDDVTLGIVNPVMGGTFNPGIVIRRQDHLLFERAGSGFCDEFVYTGP